MTHRAFVNFWVSGDSDLALLDRFERLLETVPLSAARPGFDRLLVRALGPAETPLIELDLRSVPNRAADVIALARDYPHADTEYEVEANWDLWQPGADGAWQHTPAPLLLLCRGHDYDDGIAVQSGQFEADLGFESLFTGGDGPLASDDEVPPAIQEKLGKNVRQLFDWLRKVESALPIEHYYLWSEGEENLEARLDDILSLH